MSYVIKFLHEVQQKALDEGIVFWPETPETLLNQFYRVASGKKACMLFHKIRMHSMPPEILREIDDDLVLRRIDHQSEGTFVFNIDKISEKDVIFHIYNQSIGLLLGYGVTVSPKAVEGTFAIRLCNQDGIEKECVTCTEAQVSDVVDALNEYFEEGDYMETLSREAFREERMSKFRPAKSKLS